MEWVWKTEADTANAARALGEALAQRNEPFLIFLEGELGAGKTAFVRALARGLGIPEEIPIQSPTFSIFREYPESQPSLLHGDLYRLGSEDELEELGLEERLESWLVVLEWAERFEDAIGKPDLLLRLGHIDHSPDARSVSAAGTEWAVNTLRELS